MPVFDSGALLLDEPLSAEARTFAVFDQRRSRWVTTPHCWRAFLSPHALEALFEDDDAQAPNLLKLPPLRRYQQDAFGAWRRSGSWGGIELPTGAGKTRIGLEAVCRCRGRALILVPTRILLRQWAGALAKAGFGSVGVWGDGQKVDGRVVVSTYASASFNLLHEGDRFDLLIVDEAHHLASPKIAMLARLSTAPVRLALSATFPREAGLLDSIAAVIGPVALSLRPTDLPEGVLAPFERFVHRVPMEPHALRELSLMRGAMRRILDVASTFGGSRESWHARVRMAAKRVDGGRELLAQHQALVSDLQGSERVLRKVQDLAESSHGSKTIVFCPSTEVTLRLSSRLRFPALVAGIGAKERGFWLQALAEGRIRGVVSCRALNEGYDLPGIDRAILIGGARSDVEYVQRLGRVLRAKDGKRVRIDEVLLEESVFLLEERRRNRVLDDLFKGMAV